MIKTENTNLGKGFVKIEKVFEEPALKQNKALRANEVYVSTVVHNGHEFDADERSMNRMTRVVTIANSLYNLKINSGVEESVAYTESYEVELPWKLTNNTMLTVTPKILAEVLNLGMVKMSTIWFKY